jgi:rare lipoprotein A
MLCRQFQGAALAMTFLTTIASGCMPPPPQVPCQCAPQACATGDAPASPPAQSPSNAPPVEAKEGSELAQHYAQARALKVLRGKATYYGDSLAGNRTASGEVYDPRAFTAAHKTLPFGTVVRVVRTDESSRVVYVRITDRGPFGERSRIIDVSRAAAEQLDMIRAGVVDVRVEVVSYPDG